MKYFDYQIEYNTHDYPDFCDAFIQSASVDEDGVIRDATESELDELNEDRDLVYRLVMERVVFYLIIKVFHYSSFFLHLFKLVIFIV